GIDVGLGGLKTLALDADLVLSAVDVAEAVVALLGGDGLLDDVALVVDELDLGVGRGRLAGHAQRALDLAERRALRLGRVVNEGDLPGLHDLLRAVDERHLGDEAAARALALPEE